MANWLQTGGNTVAEKRVDLAYNAIGQFTSIARYKDTDGGSTHEVATANYSYDSLGRLTWRRGSSYNDEALCGQAADFVAETPLCPDDGDGGRGGGGRRDPIFPVGRGPGANRPMSTPKVTRPPTKVVPTETPYHAPMPALWFFFFVPLLPDLNDPNCKV